MHRVAAIGEAGNDILAACAVLLHSAELRELDDKRAEITRASGDLAFRLASAANAGLGLLEDVRVRDLEAERRRDEARPDGEEGAPIYTIQPVALGSIEGAMLVRTQSDVRDHLIAVQRTVRAVRAVIRDGTDAKKTNELLALARAVDEAHRAAVDALIEVRRAHLFFSPTNLNRLARWSTSQNGFDLSAERGGLRIQSGAREIVIPPLPALMPIDLPTIAEASEKNIAATAPD